MCLSVIQPDISHLPSPKGGGEVVLGDGSRHPILQGLEGLLGQRPGSQLLHDVKRKKAVGARSGRWRRCSMSLKLLAAIKSFTTVVMVQTGTLHRGRVPLRWHRQANCRASTS